MILQHSQWNIFRHQVVHATTTPNITVSRHPIFLSIHSATLPSVLYPTRSTHQTPSTLRKRNESDRLLSQIHKIRYEPSLRHGRPRQGKAIFNDELKGCRWCWRHRCRSLIHIVRRRRSWDMSWRHTHTDTNISRLRGPKLRIVSI